MHHSTVIFVIMYTSNMISENLASVASILLMIVLLSGAKYAADTVTENGEEASVSSSTIAELSEPTQHPTAPAAQTASDMPPSTTTPVSGMHTPVPVTPNATPTSEVTPSSSTQPETVIPSSTPLSPPPVIRRSHEKDD